MKSYKQYIIEASKEAEVLLDRGQRYRVKEVEYKKLKLLTEILMVK